MNEFRPAYDTSTLAILRNVLDEVLTDRLFLETPSVSSLEVAEHLLSLAAKGERNADKLKASMLGILRPSQAA